MACKKTPQEWEHAITVLKRSAAEFSEDYSVMEEEIIDYWIAEGFLDSLDDINEARNEAHDVIGYLKGACLLETGVDMEYTVKLHDLVRDLAIWIASDFGRNKSKVFCQGGDDPKLENWEKAERVLLINNRWIFQFMPVLRVLKISRIKNTNLPKSIASLSELQYLNISGSGRWTKSNGIGMFETFEGTWNHNKYEFCFAKVSKQPQVKNVHKKSMY
ncbi:hypothetical protein BVC80_8991g33 [Macleaya cordata]|uniref:Disease resistance protein winged helix domain-containing protein n=1 Tax=Macleaya cordata TaxID=56857 RepID=A0A200QBT5_MACCD|nr:hypothetical protein BVC80_8991g33 [Macleaya cordata]